MDRAKQVALALRAWSPLVAGGYEVPAASQAMNEAAELLETSVAEEWCHYMDAEVSKAADPLKQLGEYLAVVLEEDHWATANMMLNAIVLKEQR